MKKTPLGVFIILVHHSKKEIPVFFMENLYITKPPPEWVGVWGEDLKGGRGASHQGRKVKGGWGEAKVIWSS